MGLVQENKRHKRRPREAFMPIAIRLVRFRDDSQAAEFLTADGTDNADKGMNIFGYPRHPRNPRLIALVESSVVAAAVRDYTVASAAPIPSQFHHRAHFYVSDYTIGP